MITPTVVHWRKMTMFKTPWQQQFVQRWVLYSLYYALFLAVVFTTFGAIGLLPAIMIPAAWYYVSASESEHAVLKVGAVVILGQLLFCVLLPGVQQARGPSTPDQCRANLQRLATALNKYQDEFGSLPPAHSIDEDGHPLLSWRVLILPYLGEGTLYNSFDLTQPWDSPQNRALLPQIPEVYHCPSSLAHRTRTHTSTSYLAVVGDRTVWPGHNARQLPQIVDGFSDTILLVEDGSKHIQWTEPRDLQLDDAISLFAAPEPEWAAGHRTDGLLREFYHGRFVVFVDGQVKFAPHGIDRETWRRLVTVNDGVPDIGWEARSSDLSSMNRLKICYYIRLLVFSMLSLMPLFVRLQ